MANAVKIIGAIAATAANFIPGVGPFISAGIAIGTNILSSALAKTGFSQRAIERTSSLRQPITHRRLPLGGEIVIGGVLTFYEVEEANSLHHLVFTLGDAPEESWDSIPIVWVDSKPVFESDINGDGIVTSGPFGTDLAQFPGLGRLAIFKHLGGPDQTVDTNLRDRIERVTNNFRGRGVAYIYIRVRWNQTIFPNGLPTVRALCRTNKVLDTRDGTRKWTPNAALVLREYLTNTSSIGAGFEAADVDDTFTDSAANTCEEIVDARPVGHAVVSVDTDNDELDLATAGSAAPLRLETGDRVEIFTTGTAPTGLSIGTSYYAIVERLVGDTYEEDDEETIALDAGDYTGDAATAIAAMDVDAKHGTGNIGTSASVTRSVIHPGVKLATSYANSLDRTAVSITGAGTGQHVLIKTGEPRYAVSGMVESDQAPKDVIDDMLSGMAGRLVWTGGQFRILPGAWRTPLTPTFDESDLWGPLRVRSRHSRRERFNAVRGILATQLATGEATDYPPVIDDTYVANDGGTEIFADIDRPWTSRVATAQRLGKIDLARHRREFRVDFPTGPQGFRAVPGSIVQITNARRGWTDKTFEVMGQEDFTLKAEGDSPPLQGCMLSLAELDSTAFDFTASTDETVKPPKAALPGGSSLSVVAPSDIVLSSGDDELFLKSDGTVVSRLKVTWTTNDGFAMNDEVQFKKTSASTWQKVGLFREGDGEVFIWDVEDGESYDVRVRTINDLGVTSDWTQAAPHTVTGKSAAPPDADTFTVARLADGTRRFAWTGTEPVDSAGWQIRYFAGTGAVWSSMTALHTGLLTASPYETNELASGSYTFGLKQLDTSGNESALAAIIEATIGDPALREVLLSRNERELGWPGTLTNGFITGSNTLEASSDGSWDGAPAWDNVATTWDTLQTTWDALDTSGGGNTLPSTWDALEDSWDTILPAASPMVYTTPEIDLGTDVAFTPVINAFGNGTVTISMQVGAESSGGATGSFVSVGATSGRYVKIRVSISGTRPTLSALVIHLDGETVVEDYEDIDTSAVTAGRFERLGTGHFKLATRGDTAAITVAAIVAFQNAGSGWTAEVLSKSTTITGDTEPAAEFQIYKDGVATDAVIDAQIKGPRAGDDSLAFGPVGTAAGTGAATGVGASTAAAVGTATGTGAASASHASTGTLASAGTAAGIGSASATGTTA